MTLLRVELSTHNIAFPQYGRKTTTIISFREHSLGVMAVNVKGMDKVKAGIRLEVRYERVRAADLNRIPTHVRDFQMGLFRTEFKAHGFRIQPSESLRLPFLTLFGHHLEAKTQTQKRDFLFEGEMI